MYQIPAASQTLRRRIRSKLTLIRGLDNFKSAEWSHEFRRVLEDEIEVLEKELFRRRQRAIGIGLLLASAVLFWSVFAG